MVLDIKNAELTVVFENGLTYVYQFAALETAFDGTMLNVQGLASEFSIHPKNEDTPPIPNTSSGTNRQN